MSTTKNQRRGVAIGLTALAGLTAGALGVVGIAQHDGAATQQQDVTLAAVVNAADAAHEALVNAQVSLNHQTFLSDDALEQSIFYHATQSTAGGGLGLPVSALYPGDATDPQDSIFNGAFSRYTEAQLVGQALQQAEWDHMLGVNQTLGVGGYETEIGTALHNDLIGADIAPTSALGVDLAKLIDPTVLASSSGFQSALSGLESTLMHTAWSDLLGAFTPHAAEAAGAAADAVSAVDFTP